MDTVAAILEIYFELLPNQSANYLERWWDVSGRLADQK